MICLCKKMFPKETIAADKQEIIEQKEFKTMEGW